MSIVSSTYVVGNAQVDGRRWVTERHTDSASTIHVCEYLADVGTDYAAVMSSRVALLNERLANEDTVRLLTTE